MQWLRDGDEVLGLSTTRPCNDYTFHPNGACRASVNPNVMFANDVPGTAESILGLSWHFTDSGPARRQIQLYGLSGTERVTSACYTLSKVASRAKPLTEVLTQLKAAA